VPSRVTVGPIGVPVAVSTTDTEVFAVSGLYTTLTL
jgi:hypothetical protein